jgi:hypothetical protein
VQVSAKRKAAILVDLPESVGANRPPLIGGFVPDLYCEVRDDQHIYLGEAKTSRDLEASHSRAQLVAFLRFLSSRGTGVLVIAVPWRSVPAARSLVRALQRLSATTSVATYFLEQLPG